MNKLRNKVILIGNVGEKPEITELGNDNKVARLSFATNEHYKNAKGEKITRTEWHTLIAWGKVAGIVEKLVTKGQELAIEGKLTYRTYQDKENVKRQVTEIVLSEMLLLGKAKKNQDDDENAL
ncbi:single-stranded DNA-binding protein [Flagellimonas nanhaiensis]|uniref:Single-stranded DNA-binding protein n=1 Tax=Flagellimonas nanhaiensis TaxID=2292706 RepID=A0A371JN14_9FLAO|nr:single-stranded DNA-binding protein [Allomuricauda nanhaiensis]RDY58598.1 single-stranded DNA-binding protein [Allomuricauda nanhaiensis]